MCPAVDGGEFFELPSSLRSALGPLVRTTDPETAHKLGIWAFANGIHPVDRRPDPDALKVTLWGREFPNPLGLAAGFDKHAETMEAMLSMGFGFVEIGSVTPEPQPGNPQPRVFRLTGAPAPQLEPPTDGLIPRVLLLCPHAEHNAIINRYGFNSEGMEAVRRRLETFARRRIEPSYRPMGLLAVNLGKNKATEDAASDYVKGLQRLGEFADILVVNISSPNTPGLRALQGRQQLHELVKRVKDARDKMTWGPRVSPCTL